MMAGAPSAAKTQSPVEVDPPPSLAAGSVHDACEGATDDPSASDTSSVPSSDSDPFRDKQEQNATSSVSAGPEVSPAGAAQHSIPHTPRPYVLNGPKMCIDLTHSMFYSLFRVVRQSSKAHLFATANLSQVMTTKSRLQRRLHLLAPRRVSPASHAPMSKTRRPTPLAIATLMQRRVRRPTSRRKQRIF